MACETEMWLHQKNVTNLCPHPPIVHCADCRCGICSAHIIECEICEAFLCSDCVLEHYRQHELKARQVRRIA